MYLGTCTTYFSNFVQTGLDKDSTYVPLSKPAWPLPAKFCK